MRFLALDIGGTRTGIAFGDSDDDIVMAKDTCTHASIDELIDHIQSVVRDMNIERLYIGLPLLPDGTEGEQAQWTKEIAQTLQTKTGISVQYIDERYTSTPDPLCKDDDAMSACKIADIALAMLKK